MWLQGDTLVNVWYFLLGFILALYVILDGFDIGVGILSLFIDRRQSRAVLMSSLSTVWDANEAWLIIWGGALFGAFPLAYATVFNALYIPITGLLVSLIFRGISFEFYSLAGRKRIWSLAFGLGSLGAAIFEGCILGGVLSGIRVDRNGMFAGGLFDWVNSVSAVVVIDVIAGFSLLGATYLIYKTERKIQEAARKWTLIFSIVVFTLAMVTAFLLPVIDPEMAASLLAHARPAELLAVFLTNALFIVALVICLERRSEPFPFIFALLVFLVTFGALWTAEYPYLVPGAITAHMAAARHNTLEFMLAGIGPVIPVIMTYNFYIYRVFRNKVREGEGYY